MPKQDRAVSIHPYFAVQDGKLEEFKQLCERFLALSADEPQCLYYSFTFNGDDVFCREAYESAEALLAHIGNIDALLQEGLKISKITRLEIHGPEEELAKLRAPLAAIGPTYFTLKLGMRR